jgi:hypothetical protein
MLDLMALEESSPDYRPSWWNNETDEPETCEAQSGEIDEPILLEIRLRTVGAFSN